MLPGAAAAEDIAAHVEAKALMLAELTSLALPLVIAALYLVYVLRPRPAREADGDARAPIGLSVADSGAPAREATSVYRTGAPHGRECRGCGATFLLSATACPHCGRVPT